MSYPGREDDDIFECRLCGECCKGYGGTYVTDEDIKAIAAYINEDAETFVEKFCRMSGSRPLLATGKNGYCIFWKNKTCTIHPVKPKMCKAWPYIESVLKDVANWKIMAGSCPGIKTDVPDEIIIKRVRKELEKTNDRHI